MRAYFLLGFLAGLGYALGSLLGYWLVDQVNRLLYLWLS